MLIDSPRLTMADRAVWDRLEAYDARLAYSARVERLEAEAVDEVARFGGDWYVSVSWGKDSVAAAHVATLARPDCRIVWVRSLHFDTPECEQVRDVFLAQHPQVRYEQLDVEPRNPKRGEPGYDTRHLDPVADHQDVLRENLTGRYVSGVRAEESRIRAASLRWHGVSTARTCRPLIRWSAVDVFAYLHRERLPVHPVYGMSYGGALDRRWLRVHPLCSAPPPRSAVHGRDMSSWEDDYYGDVIRAAIVARRHMWERTAGR